MAAKTHVILKTDLIKRLAPRFRRAPYRGAAGFVLAVSGGLDSMVLLDVAARLAPLHGAPLRVAHVHHRTGAFADAALALVQDECGRRGLALQVGELPPWRGNFEYEAAAFRRRFLADCCAPGEFALLAHHLQDQAETVLQTLVRGAGIATPLGMVEAHEQRLRPLLDVARDLILDHATRCEVRYLEDPTNADTDHFRNLLRHQVLPPMRAVYGQLDRQLAGFAEEWSALRTELEREATKYFGAAFAADERLLRRVALETAPNYLRPFILRQFWRACGVANPRRRQAEALMGWLAEGRQGSFEHAGLRCWCDRDGIVLEPVPASTAQVGRFGEPLDWGAWRLRVDAAGAQGQTFSLLPDQPLGDALRERLRRQQVPQRMRAQLPTISWGEQRFSPERWSQQTHLTQLTVEVLQPPSARAFLQRLLAKPR